MSDGRTISDVQRAGQGVRIACRRTHVGLKNAKSCKVPVALDVGTLAALYGPMMPLASLAKQLHCPGCGSGQIELEITGEDRSPPAVGTLGAAPEEVFFFRCIVCPRRGRYARATLLRKFGPHVMIPKLPAVVAAARGCTESACGARYDIAEMYKAGIDG